MPPRLAIKALTPCWSLATKTILNDLAPGLGAEAWRRSGAQTRSKTTFPSKRSLSGAAAPTNIATPENSRTTGLRRLKLSALLRNIFMGVVFTSPRLQKVALPLINRIAHSHTTILNPDKNFLLRLMLKPTIYDQFCAGANDREIAVTRDGIKEMGFSGVVLCFGKETQLDKETKCHVTGSAQEDEVAYWRDGNLETLDMAREGDWIGIKLTGAGTATVNDLITGHAPSSEFTAAMDAICRRALAKGCKIWVDAEQQAVQAGIDAWTVGLMRRFNQGGQVLVYNTLQAYLKDARTKLKAHLALAHNEGWQLAVKVVRGAYMANDVRHAIHDTKADTDESYNGIVADVLRGTNLGFESCDFPGMQLLIAGHNPDSALGAFQLMADLADRGVLKTIPDFAQLQGMADVLGCELLLRCEQFRIASDEVDNGRVPRVYKCLTWGSVQECIQYLLRRMVENGAASDRIKDGLSVYVGELRRRVFG